ncbi:MAG: SDR family NAD(P)-dependent oxidoreductase [Alphaproteobacteria bacterium]
MSKSALIVGAGSGLSAALARKFAEQGWQVALAARRPEKLTDLCKEIGARAYGCDVVNAGEVAALFENVAKDLGSPEIVVFNPSARVVGPLVELDPAEVAKAVSVTAFGGFLVGQAAARAMLAAGGGTILFTGASASVKGYARSAPFAMGKFALRGLAQSMARELAPQNIHVAHIVIDGGIASALRPAPADKPDALLDPGAIAQTYLALANQHRSAWTWEVELRPWVESF